MMAKRQKNREIELIMKKAPKSSTRYRKGAKIAFPLPPMNPGRYAVSLAAAPKHADGDQGGGIRVNVHFGITTETGDMVLPNELGYEKGADFGVNGLPRAFLAMDCNVQIDSQPVSVYLQIDAIHNQNDFQNNEDAGWISDICFSKVSLIQLNSARKSRPNTDKKSKPKK
jgi:hypothetical protein